MTNPTIRAIFGHEPMREGEYPSTFIVGQKVFGPDLRDGATVTRIVRRDENFGDHGIGWFDVYADKTLIRSISHRATAEVHYETGGSDGA